MENTLVLHDGIDQSYFAACDMLKESFDIKHLIACYGLYVEEANTRGAGFILAGMFLVTPSFAQQQSASPSDVEELEATTVTATRVKKQLDRVPASVGFVEQEQIQLSTQQLGLDESLVRIPGLFMQNRYNFAQDLRIAIRGFGARANFGIRGIKILADGIPETLPDGQGNVDSIDLGSTERVEVIRGPASSLYGNASGGAILITTERGPVQPFVEFRPSFGNFGFRKYQAKAGGQAGDFNYLLNASHLDYDGFRSHSRTEITQLNSKFTFEINASSDLTAVFNFTDSPQAQDPGALTREQVAQDREQAQERNIAFDTGEQLDQQRLGLVYRKALGTAHEFTLRNYYVWRDFNNKLPFVDGGAVDLGRFFYGGGGQYAYTRDLLGRPNRLIVGVDVDQQDDDRRRFDNNTGAVGDLVFDQNEDVNSLGIYLQNEFRVLGNVELTFGVRYDRVRFDVTDNFLADGDDSGKLTFDELSPMGGLLFSLTPTLNLYTTISTSFETPTTAELANPSGAGGFNSDLDSQTSTNYEIGAKGTLAGGRYRYELALFTIDVEDELIPFEIANQPGRDFFENAGTSTRDGVEFLMTAYPVQGLTASLAYTYSDFTFDRFLDADGNVFDGNKIPGIPDHLVHAEIAYDHPLGFYGIWEVFYADSFFVDNANTESNDDYTVSNLRVGYTGYYGQWSFSPFLGVNNIFDEEYNSNVRINAFGRRFFEPAPDRNSYGGFTLRYNFG